MGLKSNKSRAASTLSTWYLQVLYSPLIVVFVLNSKKKFHRVYLSDTITTSKCHGYGARFSVAAKSCSYVHCSPRLYGTTPTSKDKIRAGTLSVTSTVVRSDIAVSRFFVYLTQ